METKLIELRDRGTFIPCIAIMVSGEDGFLARRAGYQDPCILFGRLNGEEFNYDPYSWRDRTFQVAHDYIQNNWNMIDHEEVIDVEFILGESKEKKRSERY